MVHSLVEYPVYYIKIPLLGNYLSDFVVLTVHHEMGFLEKFFRSLGHATVFYDRHMKNFRSETRLTAGLLA